MLHVPRTLLAAFVVLCVLATSAGEAIAGPRIIDDGDDESPPTPSDSADPTDPGASSVPTDPPSTGTTEAPTPRTSPVLAPPTAYRHEGFHLRILAGADLWFASQDDFGAETSVIGAGVPILTGGVEVGYAFIENLIGFVEVMFNGGPIVEATVDGNEFAGEGSFWGLGLGLGGTYYIMPSNLYVAGSAGTAWIAFSDDEPPGSSGATENGFYVAAKIGIEWWVSEEWGMGVAGRAVYMHLPDDESAVDNFGFGAFFSTTYN